MAKELTRKERQITELYLETTLEVAKSTENWISFLKRASYNYKYRFDEQILIYAQRPDAVACAETVIWNKRLKRWINKGSKGIALITEKDGELGLRFVFDVSDTNSDMYGRKLKLWNAEEKYTDDIVEALEDKFGKMEDKSNLPFSIISTVYNCMIDNMQDYLNDLETMTANSNLEELTKEQLESEFFNILLYSTTTLVMARCGLDVNDYIPKGNFSGIERFNTFETISVLGTATRDLSREILLEISKTILNVQKQENKKIYTFEQNKEKIYNKEKEKGSVEDEFNLHPERKLSDTRFSNREESNRESEIRQVRKDEVKILERTQERNLHNASREQQTDKTFDDNRGNSDRENATDNRTNAVQEWDNREIENERPTRMGGTNEQHQSDSRADSSKRDNLQLNNEQAEKEVENTSFFDDETIKNILKNAPNVKKNERAFIEFIFDNYEDKTKCKEYIKQILGNAYTEFEIDGIRVGYKENEENLTLWTGNYLNRTEECSKSWDVILDYYVSDIVKHATPENNKDIYTLIVGDTVYLGMQEFVVLDIDDEQVIMYDKHFPLDQRTVKTKGLMQKIKENPLNDYLMNREMPIAETKEESAFDKWLDTFVEEKQIDLGQIIEIKTDDNIHYFEIGNIIENIKSTTPEEQAEIKNMIVKIDFYNGDVIDYFKHLAQALANNYEKETPEKSKNQEDTNIIPNIIPNIIKKNKNIEYFDLHPEIPAEERNNFKIKDDNLGVGTAKEKFRNNINAIKVLKLCEEQNRYATPEEQQILSKYVGWGGLKSAFDEKNDSWAKEYAELKEILNDEEYKNARASSVTAYYTPPIVIRSIYKALENMGLQQANILEPSCRCR